MFVFDKDYYQGENFMVDKEIFYRWFVFAGYILEKLFVKCCVVIVQWSDKMKKIGFGLVIFVQWN